MYTFEALPVINTVNDHSGFYLILSIFATLFVMLLIQSDTELQDIKIYTFFSVLAISIAGAISFNTGEIVTPVNEQVTGHFEGFVAEGYDEDRKSGKTTYRATVHNTYVVYSINEERILFKASAGMSYPKTAILYKN